MNHTTRIPAYGLLPLLLCLLSTTTSNVLGQTGTQITTLEENKQLVRRFVEAQNTGNLEVYDDLLAADFVRHNTTSGQDLHGREAYKAFLREDQQVFPDFKADVEMMLAEGNRVALYGTISGTQRAQKGPFPPTGKTFETKIVGFFQIEQGRIAELWVEWNTLDLLTQLGHIAAPQAGRK